MNELLRAQKCLAEAARKLTTPQPPTYLDAEWLKRLDGEELERFAFDIAHAPADKVGEVLHRWYATAETLKNPRAREVLLAPNKRKDYEYLLQPEAENLPARTPLLDP
jgi:hypothetical protein